ncbi:MAG: gluconate 2-dehydrogenase subunit 3 family protein [Parcubacteria group bacterium]
MSYELNKTYNSLGRFEKWDAETQKAVSDRLKDETRADTNFIFFSPFEGEILETLIDILIPQKKDDNYIKIPAVIDRKLANGKSGVRYGLDSWTQEFYKTGLAEFSRKAKEIYGKPLEDFRAEQLNKFATKFLKKDGSDFLNRFMRKVLADATVIYYSHPLSWNQIGFPGPAYPEGYAYLDCGEADAWEPKYTKKDEKEYS